MLEVCSLVIISLARGTPVDISEYNGASILTLRACRASHSCGDWILVAITLVATWAQYGSLFKMLQISTTAAVSVMWFLGFVALSETMNRYIYKATYTHMHTHAPTCMTSCHLFHCLHNVQWKICNSVTPLPVNFPVTGIHFFLHMNNFVFTQAFCEYKYTYSA